MINLQDFLTESQLALLKKYLEVANAEQRQILVKSLFHQPEIFQKIKPMVDPTWLSYDIFINKQAYGLQ